MGGLGDWGQNISLHIHCIWLAGLDVAHLQHRKGLFGIVILWGGWALLG